MRGGIGKAVIILLALAVALPASAEKRDKAEKDTIKVPFINGIAVHADLIGLILMSSSEYGYYEAGVRVNLKDRYFPAFELGYGKANETENFVEESWCKAKAPYFRVGCDFNILRDKHDKYKLYVGARYGFSSFSYDMTVAEEVIDESAAAEGTEGGEEEAATATETSTEKVYVEHDGLKAKYHWMELVLGVDAKVFGPLHLGWDIRYRHKLKQVCDDAGAPWYIPGYGNKKNAGITATFYVTISI